MSSDTEKRKVILLVVGGVLLAILVCIYAFWKLFGSSPEVPIRDQVTVFPASETASNTLMINDANDVPSSVPNQLPVNTATDTPSDIQPSTEQESDWRDEVIEYSYDNSSSFSNNPLASDVTAPTPVDVPEISPVPYSPPPSYVTPRRIYNPSQFYTKFPELSENNFSDCGEVEVPTTQGEINSLISTLAEKAEVICLGKAIANNCSGARAKVFSIYTSGYLYVAERNDGVCGIGSSVDNDKVTLCSVEATMNDSTNEQKSLAEWQKIFKDEPGQTIADVFTNILAAPVVSIEGPGSDCQVSIL